MDFLLTAHRNFLREVTEAAKVDGKLLSLMPSALFLPSAFLLVYGYVHRYTSSFTSLKRRFYRECAIHWVFFYVTRIWFLAVRGGRLLVRLLEDHLPPPSQDALITFPPHFVVFSLLLVVSLVPLVLLVARWYCRESMPNFLMWVAEDPWMHSEIGTAGHYLERPPTFAFPPVLRRRERYRELRRTTSADYVALRGSFRTIRPSKSLQTQGRHVGLM